MITIIVLLILAGITINALTGSDSAPAKANEAKQKNDMGAAKDEITITAQNAQMEAYDDVYVKTSSTTAGEAGSAVSTYVIGKLQEKYPANSKKGLANISIDANGNITITTTDFTETGKIKATNGVLEWDGTTTGGNGGSSSGNNGSGENNGGNQGGTTPTPTELTIESLQTTATKPYLPTGYSIAQESKAATDPMAEGLIITDGSGNEYVWVEVPRTIYSSELQAITAGTNLTDAQYTAIETAMQTYATSYRNSQFCTNATDTYNTNMGTIGNITNENDYNTLKKKMLKSVFENGGFYVGRYEAGIEVANARTVDSGDISSTLVPLSKANVAPINWVTCSQAQTLASRVAPNGNTSSLMFGIQWDLMLKFIEEKTSLTTTDITSNSGSWGNYEDVGFNVNSIAKVWNSSSEVYEDINPDSKPSNTNKLLTTGATKGASSPDNNRNSKANIHDVAGNECEWTLEFASISITSQPYCQRGGNYEYNGSSGPAVYRYYGGTSYNYESYGLRVSLY